MGAVGDFFSDVGRKIQKTADEVARDTNALIQRNKVLAAAVAIYNPASTFAIYAATQAGPITQAAYDMTVKPMGDLRWYWFLNPITPWIGAYQHGQEKMRRERNARQNTEAEALAADIAYFQNAVTELAAEKATGELRLLQSRIAATYVGPGTFITDDKPAEWRMYEQLYKVKLLSSEEWKRQRVAASQRPFGMGQVEDAFARAARHFRSRM